MKTGRQATPSLIISGSSANLGSSNSMIWGFMQSARSPAEDIHLRQGLNVMGGKITYKAVAVAHGLDYQPLEEALGFSY